MCIVIDTNALSMVFNEADTRHSEFRLVKTWINARLGVVVYGGTKYKEELHKANRYMRLIRQLRDAGQAIPIQDDAVDRLETDVHKKTKGTDCDDQHIIALLGASRCALLCSADAKAYPFVKDKTLYPKGTPSVKIYSSPRNKNLLKKSDISTLKNIASEH